MERLKCTVDEAVQVLTTAEEMQDYALDNFPLQYIDKLIAAFRQEPTDEPDHEIYRLCETIPMLTEETAIRLVQIHLGFLRTELNHPI